MNSPFANIFLSVQARIASIVDTNNNRIINFADQDLKQLYKDERPRVSYPCALIDFENWDFQNMGTNAQIGVGYVVILLGFAPYSNSSDATPEPYKEKALNYYDIEWQLHKALQGWSPTYDLGNGQTFESAGYLTRTSATTDNNRVDMRIRRIMYKLEFEDYSTQLQESTVLSGFAPGVTMP